MAQIKMKCLNAVTVFPSDKAKKISGVNGVEQNIVSFL